MPTNKKKTQKGTRTLKSRNSVKKFESAGDKYTYWLAHRTELTLQERLKALAAQFGLTKQRYGQLRKIHEWDRLHEEKWLPALWEKQDEVEAAEVVVMDNEPPPEETLDIKKFNTKVVRVLNLGLHINNDLISHCARMVKMYALRIEKILQRTTDVKFLDFATKSELERCEVQLNKYVKMSSDFTTPAAIKLFCDVLGLKETLFAEDKEGITLTPTKLLQLMMQTGMSQVLMNPEKVEEQLQLEMQNVAAQQGTFAIELPDISPKSQTFKRRNIKPQKEQ